MASHATHVAQYVHSLAPTGATPPTAPHELAVYGTAYSQSSAPAETQIIAPEQSHAILDTLPLNAIDDIDGPPWAMDMEATSAAAPLCVSPPSFGCPGLVWRDGGLLDVNAMMDSVMAQVRETAYSEGCEAGRRAAQLDAAATEGPAVVNEADYSIHLHQAYDAGFADSVREANERFEIAKPQVAAQAFSEGWAGATNACKEVEEETVKEAVDRGRAEAEEKARMDAVGLQQEAFARGFESAREQAQGLIDNLSQAAAAEKEAAAQRIASAQQLSAGATAERDGLLARIDTLERERDAGVIECIQARLDIAALEVLRDSLVEEVEEAYARGHQDAAREPTAVLPAIPDAYDDGMLHVPDSDEETSLAGMMAEVRVETTPGVQSDQSHMDFEDDDSDTTSISSSADHELDDTESLEEAYERGVQYGRRQAGEEWEPVFENVFKQASDAGYERGRKQAQEEHEQSLLDGDLASAQNARASERFRAGYADGVAHATTTTSTRLEMLSQAVPLDDGEFQALLRFGQLAFRKSDLIRHLNIDISDVCSCRNTLSETEIEAFGSRKEFSREARKYERILLLVDRIGEKEVKRALHSRPPAIHDGNEEKKQLDSITSILNNIALNSSNRFDPPSPPPSHRRHIRHPLRDVTAAVSAENNSGKTRPARSSQARRAEVAPYGRPINARPRTRSSSSEDR